MAKFIALVSYQGPLPAGYADQPAPDPAMFGLPAEDDGCRNDPLLGPPPVTFPGGHDGFLGGEYGGMGEPDAFAATLHTVLDD